MALKNTPPTPNAEFAVPQKNLNQIQDDSSDCSSGSSPRTICSPMDSPATPLKPGSKTNNNSLSMRFIDLEGKIEDLELELSLIESRLTSLEFHIGY